MVSLMVLIMVIRTIETAQTLDGSIISQGSYLVDAK